MMNIVHPFLATLTTDQTIAAVAAALAALSVLVGLVTLRLVSRQISIGKDQLTLAAEELRIVERQTKLFESQHALAQRKESLRLVFHNLTLRFDDTWRPHGRVSVRSLLLTVENDGKGTRGVVVAIWLNQYEGSRPSLSPADDRWLKGEVNFIQDPDGEYYREAYSQFPEMYTPDVKDPGGNFYQVEYRRHFPDAILPSGSIVSLTSLELNVRAVSQRYFIRYALLSENGSGPPLNEPCYLQYVVHVD